MLTPMISPAARNDPAYVQQLARAVSYLIAQNQMTVTPVTASYAVNTPGEVVLASAASGAVTISLPFAKPFMGYTLTVKKTDNTANAVTVAAQSGETVDGSASRSLAGQWASYTLFSNGVGWFIL